MLVPEIVGQASIIGKSKRAMRRDEVRLTNKRDKQLWKLAKQRVRFRRHMYAYLFVNTAFWLIWIWQTGGRSYAHPWPIWPSLGWGLGLFIHYLDAFHDRRSKAVEREYHKLSSRREPKE
jgi:hypothetical protein